MAILLLTSPDDTAADRVEAELRRRGAHVVRFDDKPFPSAASITLRCASGTALRHSIPGVPLGDIHSAWDRRPRTATPPPHITDSLLRAHIEREASWFMDDVWETLDCHWFPARRLVIRRAEHKASQLQAAVALGLEIPPTIITNDPRELLDFYREHGGDIVSKSFMHPAVPAEEGETSNFWVARTEPVTRRDIAHVQAVRDCPVIFQAYVPKRVELRVTIVGTQLFPMEIHSQDTNRTRYDWRRYDLAHTVHRRHELPAEVERKLLAFMAHFGLEYGAADLIVTPDGRYVFLEVNPNGQYGWAENMTGMPIGAAIADHLMAFDAARPVAALA
ncbi:MAG: MvdC/MvdD family ATP grasp protein [Gemmatimonadaceae bacterium]